MSKVKNRKTLEYIPDKEEAKDLTGLLLCNIHYRVLIGKDKCVDCKQEELEPKDTQPKCQFCGKPATKPRYKPDEEYPMAYDLCDSCAEEHKKAWDSLKPTDQKPIWADEYQKRFGDYERNGAFMYFSVKQFIKEVEKAAYERGYSDGISYYINKYKIVEPSNGLETYWEQLESSVNTPEENWYEMGRKLKK